jgi:hypothetical protein
MIRSYRIYNKSPWSKLPWNISALEHYLHWVAAHIDLVQGKIDKMWQIDFL